LEKLGEIQKKFNTHKLDEVFSAEVGNEVAQKIIDLFRVKCLHIEPLKKKNNEEL
jgi:uncharacterized hydantoinase/oxoprolinase family protein